MKITEFKYNFEIFVKTLKKLKRKKTLKRGYCPKWHEKGAIQFLMLILKNL